MKVLCKIHLLCITCLLFSCDTNKKVEPRSATIPEEIVSTIHDTLVVNLTDKGFEAQLIILGIDSDKTINGRILISDVERTFDIGYNYGYNHNLISQNEAALLNEYKSIPEISSF